MENFQVSTEEVLSVIKSTDINKSSGPDGIHPRIIKECAPTLSPILTHIFNESLKEGKLPHKWKEGTIVPILKKGDESCPSNYRPICLTSSICKILEKIIRKKILEHLTFNSTLSNHQYSFIPGRSVVQQLSLVTDRIINELDTGNSSSNGSR